MKIKPDQSDSFPHFVERASQLIGRDLSPSEQASFRLFHDRLLQWNRRLNLMSSSVTSSVLLERHFLDCLAVWPWVAEFPAIADLGSGAGLPGMLLAMVQGDHHLTLVEPHFKKWTFLDETIRELSVKATALCVSDGDVRGEFDLVTSRAYASLAHLLAVSFPLLRPGGRLVAFKGRQFQNELTPLVPWPSGWTPVRIVPNPASAEGGVFIVTDKCFT